MSDSVNGRVEQFFQKKDDGEHNMPHKLVVDGEDYSTWKEVGDIPNIQKGDRVELEYFVNDNGYNTINDVEVVEASEDGATREGKNDQLPQNSDSGVEGVSNEPGKSQPTSLTNRDRQILVQVAFKEACSTMRQEEKSLDEELSQAEKLEVVSEYTNGFYNVLEAQIKDKVSD